MSDKKFVVRYIRKTTPKLVQNKIYLAAWDKSTRYLRVKDETGKWSKYAPEKFHVFDSLDADTLRDIMAEIAKDAIAKDAKEESDSVKERVKDERTWRVAEYNGVSRPEVGLVRLGDYLVRQHETDPYLWYVYGPSGYGVVGSVGKDELEFYEDDSAVAQCFHKARSLTSMEQFKALAEEYTWHCESCVRETALPIMVYPYEYVRNLFDDIRKGECYALYVCPECLIEKWGAGTKTDPEKTLEKTSEAESKEEPKETAKDAIVARRVGLPPGVTRLFPSRLYRAYARTRWEVEINPITREYETYDRHQLTFVEEGSVLARLFRRTLACKTFEELKEVGKESTYFCENKRHASYMKRALPIMAYPPHLVGSDLYSRSENFLCSECALELSRAHEHEKYEPEKSEKVESKPMSKEESSMEKKKVTLRDYLMAQGVPSSLIDDVVAFRKEYKLDEAVMNRVVRPTMLYQGPAWTSAIAAILEGHNVLLEGPKATGKNVLCQSLAYLFGRPIWDVSFHVNMDASYLIGDDTFKNNEVTFRPGPIYEAAKYGGFAVLDEINMAKSEAVAVLHAILDDRRVIDVPGHERIQLHPATRFIGTMNYGYTGTRELNEALVSRFVVISIPSMTDAELTRFLKAKFPQLAEDALGSVVRTFMEIGKKAMAGEISSRGVDLRGIISGIQLVRRGIRPQEAFKMSVVNKVFDEYERKIVEDVVNLNVSEAWESNYFFPTETTITIDFGGVH